MGPLRRQRLIRTGLQRAVRRAGFELQPIRTEPIPLQEFATPTDAIYSHGDPVFELPLRACFYPYAFSYDPAGWHPFVATLRELRQEPSLAYGESTLYRFYASFAPATIRQVLFEDGFDSTGAERLDDYPAHQYLPLLPWDPRLNALRGEKGLEPGHGHQGYGPVSDEKGELEFRRLAETMRSIEQRGYRPAPHEDGDIRGYFLKTPNDYRFVIRSGLHRAAALVALDYERIRVGFFRNYPRAIHLCDVGSWPMVRSGLMSAEAAERYFRRFFNENGREKAARLGLVADDRPQTAINSRTSAPDGVS